MVLSYKYKLEPTNDQKLLLNNHFFIFNQAWNITISSHIKSRDEGLPYLDNTELDRMIKPILKDRNLSFNTKIVQRAIALANQAIQINYKNQKNRKSKDSKAKFSDISYRVRSEPKLIDLINPSSTFKIFMKFSLQKFKSSILSFIPQIYKLTFLGTFL